MILERDTYFVSKHGLQALQALKSLQATGIKIEQILGGEFGSERDDFLPDQTSVKTEGLASKRSAHAADQLQRAGGISAGSMAEVFGMMGRNDARAAREGEGYEEEYSTDEESGPRKRRRRRRVETPVWSQEDEMGEIKEEIGNKAETGQEVIGAGDLAVEGQQVKPDMRSKAEHLPEVKVKREGQSEEILDKIKVETPQTNVPTPSSTTPNNVSASHQSGIPSSAISRSNIKVEPDLAAPTHSPTVKVERSSRSCIRPRKFVVNMAHVKALALAEKETMG